MTLNCHTETPHASFPAKERQITKAQHNHILTNAGVWSPDSEWIVYDMRSTGFDGPRIEAVNVQTGEIKVIYESRNGAYCGVVTCSPREKKSVFILGPENPTPDWQYDFSHRQGVIVDWSKPGVAVNLDGRDLTPPFTAGALRGGSHVHVWDSQGDWVSYTYNDALVESDIRDIAVSAPRSRVSVSKKHPRNHDGEYFSVLASRTLANPKPDSDEIKRACEEAWVGANGYLRADGVRQKRALAFQGSVVTAKGETLSEVFIVDLPEDLTQPGESPIAGTETTRPNPPRGATQRRLTFTAGRKFPGLQGPRHWLRSSPDGSRIVFLMKDDAGIVQLWTISPNGGAATQLTHNPWPVASSFTWSPDGRHIAHVMDNSVYLTDATTGKSQRVTERTADAIAPQSEACVYSPDGKKLAFQRRKRDAGHEFNQVCVAFLKE
ncbi:MAG: DUF3748 domain-containing protein [Verrucomicrobia bacterium]|nr:DUF3748 domain-containing protein [Verrucomicrobiota bacterium]